MYVVSMQQFVYKRFIFVTFLVEAVAVAVVVVSATNTLGTEANFAKEWL